MTDLTQGTWVLVADGEKAMFLENVTDDDDPYFRVRRLEEQDNPSNHDTQADRPGRRSDGVSGHSSGMEEADWHRIAKEKFASELADALLRLVRRKAYDRLVIVAPARTLGALRQALHKEVSDRVVAEIGKDFTNHPLNEVEQRVREELHKG